MNKVVKGLRGSSKGVSAIEVMIALAILGIVAVAFLSGLFTAFKADIIADERSVAQSLATSEIEYVKSCKYEDIPIPSWSYELPSNPPSWDGSHALPPGYEGYSLTVEGNIFDADGDGADDNDIQKITVIIYHDTKKVFTLEDYKVYR